MSARRTRSLRSDVLAVACNKAMVLRWDKPLIATMLIQPITLLSIFGTAVSLLMLIAVRTVESRA
jgi:hypothetical protein